MDRETIISAAEQAGPRGGLSQRSRDLLTAIRDDEQAAHLLTGGARGPVPLAFVIAADPAADAETATVMLSRQLVARSGGPVALLMLDPLGATLRLFRPAGRSVRQVARRPQYRVANRGDWNVLLDRLPADTAQVLLLDLTGRQSRLTDQPEAAPTVVVVAGPDRAGRLAAYGAIKELAAEGVGQIGLFFVDSPPRRQSASASDSVVADEILVSDTAPSIDSPERDSGGTVVSDRLGRLGGRDGTCSSDCGGREEAGSASGALAQDARPVLAERAAGAFVRLGAAARRFLGREVTFLGYGWRDGDRASDDSAIQVDLVGQRPAVDGDENRAELTRWLVAYSRPMDPISVAPPAAASEPEDALPAVTALAGPGKPVEAAADQPPPVEPEALSRADMAGPDVMLASPAGPSAGEGIAAGAFDGPLPTAEARPGIVPEAPATVAAPCPLPAALPVVALEAAPNDPAGWSDLLAAHIGLIAHGAAVVPYRPPADPLIVLAAGGELAGRLILVRGAIGSDSHAAVLSLVAACQWARQHWQLLRLAFSTAALSDEVSLMPILVGQPVSAAVRQLAAAALSADGPARFFNVVGLDLSRLGGQSPPAGLVLSESI